MGSLLGYVGMSLLKVSNCITRICRLNGQGDWELSSWHFLLLGGPGLKASCFNIFPHFLQAAEGIVPSGRPRPLPKSNKDTENKTRIVCITWYWVAFMWPLLQWKSVEYYTICVCICSFRYPACNVRAPYYHPWPAPLCSMFPHFLLDGTIKKKKKLLNIMFVFWFFLQLLSEIFFIWRRTEWDMIENVIGFHVQYQLH
jgi:hypothetical protein